MPTWAAIVIPSCTVIGSLLGIIAGFYMTMNKFVTKRDLTEKCAECKRAQAAEKANLESFIKDVKKDFHDALQEVKDDFRSWLSELKKT